MAAERGELPLSNPAETINLAGIAEPGIGWCLGCVYALAAVRCQTHIRTADPAAGSDRERRSGKRCWELCDVAVGSSRENRQALSGFPLEFRTPEPCCS